MATATSNYIGTIEFREDGALERTLSRYALVRCPIFGDTTYEIVAFTATTDGNKCFVGTWKGGRIIEEARSYTTAKAAVSAALEKAGWGKLR